MWPKLLSERQGNDVSLKTALLLMTSAFAPRAQEETCMGFLLVFVGSGIGGMARHGVNLAALRWFGPGFPAGTLAINIAGSLLMGIVAEYWAIKSGLPQPVRLFLTTGVIGGFTTFSAFSLETALLWERGQSLTAMAYVAASVALSIGALFGGLWLVRVLVGRGNL
jgi:CrcB protein